MLKAMMMAPVILLMACATPEDPNDPYKLTDAERRAVRIEYVAGGSGAAEKKALCIRAKKREIATGQPIPEACYQDGAKIVIQP